MYSAISSTWRGTEVLDLFSGTGSISYEFISRGAAGVTSVEVNAVHHNFIRRTAAAFGMENLYAVRANAFLYLKSASKRFDVIFSDAPYDLEGSEQVVELVFERKLLCPGGLLIFEHSKERSFEGQSPPCCRYVPTAACISPSSVCRMWNSSRFSAL